MSNVRARHPGVAKASRTACHWQINAVLLCLTTLLGVAGCAPGAGRDGASPTLESITAAGPGGLPALPAPSALKLSSFTEAGLYRQGYEYAAELPHNYVSQSGNNLVFKPYWPDNHATADLLAYAGYAFDLAGYDRDHSVRLGWSELPPQAGTWVGLADFSRDRWRWLKPDAQHAITADFTELMAGGTTLVVLVLATGNNWCTLENVRVGERQLPQIESVSPLSGFPHCAAQITAQVSGTEPLQYNWSFGSAAAPMSSSERAPQVMLGSVGGYSCSLTVSNSLGEDSFEFSLEIAEPPPAGPWPMYGCDAQHSRRSTAAGPESPQLAWAFQTTGPGFTYSEAAFGADGTIYLGAGTDTPNYRFTPEVVALHPDGSEKWRSDCISPTTPVTVGQDGTLYVGCSQRLYALNPEGQTLWYTEIPQTVTNPVVQAGSGDLLVQTDNNCYCVSPAGTLLWAFTGEGDIFRSYSKPALAPDGTAYITSMSGRLVAINPDGTLKWRFSTPWDSISSPAVALDGTIYFGNNNSSLYAVNPDGTLKWEYSAAPDLFVLSPVIGPDGMVYCASVYTYDDRRGTLFALNPDGRRQWSAQLDSLPWFSGPTIMDDGTILVGDRFGALTAYSPGAQKLWTYAPEADPEYVIDEPRVSPDGRIIYSGYYGTVYALKPDGALDWTFTGGGGIDTEPVVDSTGTSYFSCMDGFTYAVRADGTLKWSFRTPDFVIVSPAVAVDGTVYVACSNGTVYALQGNGSLAWQYQTSPIASDRFLLPPVIAVDGAVTVVDRDNAAFTLNPDGALRWSAAGNSSDIIHAAPLFHPNGNLLTSSRYDLWAVDMQGDVAWGRHFGANVYLLAASSAGTVFCQQAGALQSLGADGASGWSSDVIDFTYVRALALGVQGEIYAGTAGYQPKQKQLIALHADGSLDWALDDGAYSYPAVDSTGTIYAVREPDAGPDEHSLTATAPDGTRQWELQLPVLDAIGAYTAPVIGANRTLLVGSSNGKLYAYSD